MHVRNEFSGRLVDDLSFFDVEGSKWTRIYSSDGTYFNVSAKVYSSIVSKKLWNIQGLGANMDTVHTLQLENIGGVNDLNAKMSLKLPKELRELERFINNVQKGLQTKVGADDTAGLMRAMEAMQNIREHSATVEFQFEVLREQVAYLKRQGLGADRQEAQVDDLNQKWNNIKKIQPRVYDDLRPLKDREAYKVKQQISVFGDKVRNAQKELDVLPVYDWDVSPESAYEQLYHFHSEVVILDEEHENLKRLASLFEFPEVLHPASAARSELTEHQIRLKQLWDLICMVTSQMDQWTTTLWEDIATDVMEDQTRAFAKEIRGLHKSVRECRAAKALELLVKNFLIALPLVADLHHPSMRPRHWDELKAATKTNFEIDDTFKLEDLMALKLHQFEEEVGEIVTRAQKEEKMEVILQKMDDFWSKLEFESYPYKESELQLVRISEEEFETLEEHQVRCMPGCICMTGGTLFDRSSLYDRCTFKI